MPTLLVLGATSDIARATAELFARHGWNIQMAGRDLAAVAATARDLEVKTGKNVPALCFDACRPETHQAFWDTLPACPDVVLCAVGVLGDQEAARYDMPLAQKILQTNFTGLVPIISIAAEAFEHRGSGTIIGISSVAGDRGRASNYVYGSAKSGFTAFLSGLRNRLNAKGVHVLTVKPGFVATRMTEGMNLPPLFTAKPEDIAKDIFQAFLKKKNSIYSLRVWRVIMFIITQIPECIFKKCKF